MSARYYTLDDNRQVVPCDLMTWGDTFEQFAKREVAVTKIDPDIVVRTMFHGLDPENWDETKPDKVFGTAIFGGKHNGKEMLSLTWDDAEAMHREMVKLAGGSQ